MEILHQYATMTAGPGRTLTRTVQVLTPRNEAGVATLLTRKEKEKPYMMRMMEKIQIAVFGSNGRKGDVDKAFTLASSSLYVIIIWHSKARLI